MDKVKPEGVERLPVYKAVIRMVEKISGKRVADMGHMNPYLVGSPGMKENIQRTSAQG